MRIVIALILTIFISIAGMPADKTPTEYGAISGFVVEAKTDSALAHANIVLVGTQLGAMSLEDGAFRIKNIPTGTYEIKVMMMGYKTVGETQVIVRANETTRLIFRLDVTIVSTTQVINVVGDREMIDVPSSDVRSSVTEEQIKEMPADNAIDAISLKTGIVKTGDELYARGGRSGHKLYPPPGGESRKVKGANYSVISRSGCSGPHVYRRSCPPPNHSGESYEDLDENGFLDVLDNPSSTFSIDVDAASYANMRRFVRSGAIPPRPSIRIEEMINYFSYDYPDPNGDHPFSISTEAASCPWNVEHRLVRIGIQGERVSMEDVPPNNLVFLLDVSGSMRDPNKLPLLRQSLPLLVEHLRREDRVAIVVYSGEARLLMASTRGDKKEEILDKIDGLYARGSTAGGAGLELAYEIAEEHFRKRGNNRVILATDGDFNVGASSDCAMVKLIEEKRESGVFLSVLGFGMGNLKDAKLEKIANHGNGHYAYIDNILEAKKVLINEMGATLFTIAKDVKIQIEFNPTKVEAYRLIGYENRMLAREDFKDDEKDAGELGAGHSVTALYEIIPRSLDRVGPNGSERPAPDRPIDDGYEYIDVAIDEDAFVRPDILTVRFRYKQPNADESTEITEVVIDDGTEFEKASIDFRFAASVAEFGMLLKDSDYQGDASYAHVIETARAARGVDNDGYRAEFVQLAEMCQILIASR